MVAIIVGMITGCICMVTALYYLIQVGDPEPRWGYVVAILGGAVFALSAVLMAVITVAQQRRAGRTSAPAKPKSKAAPAPEPQPLEEEVLLAEDREDRSKRPGMREVDVADWGTPEPADPMDLALESDDDEKEEGNA